MIFQKRYMAVVMAFYFANSFALSPVSPPDELLQESANVQLVHRGLCTWQDQQVHCMVGIDMATETYWLLVFDEKGTLTHVVNNKDNIETIRWVHPMLVA
jgi:hypothetical protein